MIRNFLTTLGLRMDSAVAAARPAQNSGQKAVLIVDDNPDSLHAMRLALAYEPFRIETADTAASALRKLSALHPDLILLDSRVPAADGTRLARRLLADEELAPIPIVALAEISKGTGTGTQGNIQAGTRFDGFIGKPVELQEFDSRAFAGQVRAFLESSSQPESRHPAKLPPPPAPTADRLKQAAELLEAIEAGLPDAQFAPGARTELHRLAGVVEGLHDDELAGYLKRAERLSHAATVRARSRFRSVIRICRELVDRDTGMAPSLAELRSGYLDNRCAELGRLEHALRNGDFATLGKAGHNLKGTGAAYGFAELTDIGRALEAAAKAGNAAAIEILLDQIDSYIGIVRPSLEG